MTKIEEVYNLFKLISAYYRANFILFNYIKKFSINPHI